jgi:hypothetical protein
VGVKKLKNESELLKLALKVGVRYGEGRGAVQFEETDSVKEKVEILYRQKFRSRPCGTSWLFGYHVSYRKTIHCVSNSR